MKKGKKTKIAFSVHVAASLHRGGVGPLGSEGRPQAPSPGSSRSLSACGHQSSELYLCIPGLALHLFWAPLARCGLWYQKSRRAVILGV